MNLGRAYALIRMSIFLYDPKHEVSLYIRREIVRNATEKLVEPNGSQAEASKFTPISAEITERPIFLKRNKENFLSVCIRANRSTHIHTKKARLLAVLSELDDAECSSLH